MQPSHVLQQASALYSAGRVSEALDLVADALNHGPNQVELLNLAAICELSMGLVESAEHRWNRAIEISPDFVEVRYNLGLLLQRQQRHAEAEARFRETLAIDPDYIEVYNSLGNVLQETARKEEAEIHYRKALELDPEYAEAAVNLGILLARAKREEEAEAAFRQALDADPGAAEAHYQLAFLLQRQRRVEDAERHFREALALRPDYPEALVTFSYFLAASGRQTEAESLLGRAIELRPDYAEAHFQLGTLLLVRDAKDRAEVSFRNVLRHDPEHVEALVYLIDLLLSGDSRGEVEALLRVALRLRPERADLWMRLGRCLSVGQQWSEAEAPLRKAIELDPELGEAYFYLGNVFDADGRYGEEEMAFREAIRLVPNNLDGYHNLANVLSKLRRYGESEDFFRQALERQPDMAKVNLGLGSLLLAAGRFAEGWPHYEFRRQGEWAEKFAWTEPVPFPEWQGESLVGKSIIAFAEQGFGDDIQFCRYLAELKRLGARTVSLLCRTPVRSLMGTLEGCDALYLKDPGERFEFPYHDYWILMLSLPYRCATTPASIPAKLPYLWADPERIRHWQPRLPAADLRVGLVWKGNPQHANDAFRSLPGLTTLAKLWTVPGIAFVSLQRGQVQGEDDAEAVAPPEGQPLTHLGGQIGDFADSAAVVAQLDLVICVDTAIAHLAGALGKPCWVLLSAIGTDWRWGRERADCPWYPGVMRLFRQELGQGWDPVIAEVAAALREFATSPRPGHADASVVSAQAAPECGGRSVENLGSLEEQATKLADSGQGDQAEPLFRRILDVQPGRADLWHRVGRLRLLANDLGGAAEAFVREVELVPDSALGHFGLSEAYESAGHLPEAEHELRETIRYRGDFVYAHLNLAALLERQGRFNEAEDSFRKAVQLYPEMATTNMALGLFLMAQGRFQEGWPFYERRHLAERAALYTWLQNMPFPEWRGELLFGKTILVCSEQGFGDDIQMCRYLIQLKRLGARRVSLLCREPVLTLLRSLPFCDAVYPQRGGNEGGFQVPYHDYWALTLSLPFRCRTTPATIPAELPYLRPDPARIDRWRSRLPDADFRVGLVWRGDPRHRNDRHRSLPGLSLLAPLWTVSGIAFISLQRSQVQGEEDPEAANPPKGQPLTHLGGQIGDFADSAAIVAQLDLVICVDTAIAHLAGALGKPCWVLLSAIGTDWRWGRKRVDCPWYPGVMRLFRQSRAGVWDEVVAAVTAALLEFRRERLGQ